MVREKQQKNPKNVKKIKKIKKREYNLVKQKKHTENWIGITGATQDEIYKSWSTSLSRARDLAENTIEGKVGTRKFSINLLGDSVKGSCYHPDFGDALDSLWLEWEEVSDFYENETFNSQLRIILNEIFVSGACLVVRQWENRKCQIPFSLQVLPVDYLYEPYSSGFVKEGRYVRNGIEYDEMGRIIGYWLYRQNPKSTLQYNFRLDPIFVPKDDCILASWVESPEVVLSQSMLNSCAETLNNFNEYKEINLLRGKVAN